MSDWLDSHTGAGWIQLSPKQDGLPVEPVFKEVYCGYYDISSTDTKRNPPRKRKSMTIAGTKKKLRPTQKRSFFTKLKTFNNDLLSGPLILSLWTMLDKISRNSLTHRLMVVYTWVRGAYYAFHHHCAHHVRSTNSFRFGFTRFLGKLLISSYSGYITLKFGRFNSILRRG